MAFRVRIKESHAGSLGLTAWLTTPKHLDQYNSKGLSFYTNNYNTTTMSSDYEISDNEGDYYDSDEMMEDYQNDGKFTALLCRRVTDISILSIRPRRGRYGDG